MHGRLRKLFNAVGVVFKGSGFYRTDSRSGASTGELEVRRRPRPSPSTKSDTKSEHQAGSRPRAEGRRRHGLPSCTPCGEPPRGAIGLT